MPSNKTHEIFRTRKTTPVVSHRYQLAFTDSNAVVYLYTNFIQKSEFVEYFSALTTEIHAMIISHEFVEKACLHIMYIRVGPIITRFTPLTLLITRYLKTSPDFWVEECAPHSLIVHNSRSFLSLRRRKLPIR